MIIGVIAALTIPSLKKSSQQQEYIQSAKKAYSSLSQATMLGENLNGPVGYWNWNSAKDIMKIYSQHFNILKECGNDEYCFTRDYDIHQLNGRSQSGIYNGETNYTFITADGMYWIMSVYSKACNTSENSYIKHSCGFFRVDVNGKKPPNTIGIDIFGFQIRKDGVYPAGGGDDCNENDCNPSGVGWGCAARVLRTGVMDYI